LQKTLLELLFEVVPAGRGAIVLTSNDGQAQDSEFASVFGLDRMRGPDQSVRVSRTITGAVLKQAASLLITTSEAKGLEAPSIVEDRPVSIPCVPLIMLDRTLGV